MVRFYFRDNFYNDRSLPTASLLAVVKPHGLEIRDWRGPLVVVALALTPSALAYLERNGSDGGFTGREDELVDVTLGNLHTVIDYSLGYRKGRNSLEDSAEGVAASWGRMGFTVLNLGS